MLCVHQANEREFGFSLPVAQLVRARDSQDKKWISQHFVNNLSVQQTGKKTLISIFSQQSHSQISAAHERQYW